MAKGKHLFFYKDKLFILSDNVYHPEKYSIFFEEHINITGGDSVLDLCTGSGFLAIMVSDKVKKVTAIDINPFSVDCAILNVKLNELTNVEVRLGDLFEAVDQSEKFDLIISWPPIFPTPVEKRRKDWVGIATEGGEDGRSVIDKIILNASKFLNKNGRLQILHAWYANIEKSMEMLKNNGFNVSVTAECYFPLGQISYERAEHLTTLGYPPIERDGQLLQYHALITASWDA